MSNRFDFIETPIAGLYKIKRKPIRDSRGFFSRFFCSEDFKEAGLNRQLVQINHTGSQKKGTVRGLHFQRAPYAETKVVSCLRGEICDVAVDIRQGSSTFLQWHSEVLSEENQVSLYIPDGFAHGFQTLAEDCELLYLHTAMHEPSAEGALNVNDPRLAINWPLPITEMSDRDKSHPMVDDDFQGLQV